MRTSIGRFGAGLALVTLILGTGVGVGVEALGADAAGATTPIVVNDATDSATLAPSACTSGDGDCTLRSAIDAFNTGSSDMTIDLPDPTTLPTPESVYNVVSEIGGLAIDSTGHTLTITYTGTGVGIIQADATSGPVTINVLTIEPGATADISGVSIQDGNTSGDGGGILTDGTLTLSNSTVINNTASDSGGGIAQTEGETSLTLTDDVISANTAGLDGGGVFADSGDVTITGGTIGGINADETLGNTATDNGGGLALEQGQGTLSGVTIGGPALEDGNGADNGGGVYVTAADPSFSGDTIENNRVTDGDGGGVYLDSGTNTLTNETIQDNAANPGDGGGVYVTDGTNTFTGGSISGNVSNDGDGGGGVYIGDGTNSFSGGSVSDNQANEGGSGGGFDIEGGTDTLTDEAVGGNSADFDGGGVYLDGGTTTIAGSTVDANTAADGGAGVYTDSGDPLAVTSSTISNNTVLPGSGDNLAGSGGGIVSEDCNPITLTNDTITGNTAIAEGGGYLAIDCLPLGAGLQHPDAAGAHAGPAAATTTFVFDTVSGNSTGDTEGGGNIQLFHDDSTVSLGQTIVAGGIVGGLPTTNCAVDTSVDRHHHLARLQPDRRLDVRDPGTADIIGKSAQLGTLGNNGGPTATELPGDRQSRRRGHPARLGAAPVRRQHRPAGSRPRAGAQRLLHHRGGRGGAGDAPGPALLQPQRLPPGGDEGGIFDFGLNFNGSLANNQLNAPIVGLANSPGPNGYVMVGSDGGVFALGGANFYGSLGGQSLPSPIAAIAAPPSETGYWLAAQNGKIYNFGSVPALPAVQLPAGAKIVGHGLGHHRAGGLAGRPVRQRLRRGRRPTYEGGVSGHLNAPVVGIAAAASGQGYILVASDGGVFNYGVGFYGSVPGSLEAGQHLVAPIVGIAVTHSGNGYWEVGADGGVFNYGDAPFLGSIYTAIPGQKLNGPIVGIQHLGAAPAG